MGMHHCPIYPFGRMVGIFRYVGTTLGHDTVDAPSHVVVVVAFADASLVV